MKEELRTKNTGRVYNMKVMVSLLDPKWSTENFTEGGTVTQIH